MECLTIADRTNPGQLILDMQPSTRGTNEIEKDGASLTNGKFTNSNLAAPARVLLRERNSKNSSNGSPESTQPKKKLPTVVKAVKQKEVVMSYKINCVSDISAILCTVEVDLKAFFRWNDEALIGRKKGMTIIASEEKGLFDPDIVISNEHNISEVSSVAKVTNSETGEVKCSKHYKGTVFLTSMDLRLFPFDCQNLQICFKPYKKPIEEVIMIRSDPAECAMESRIAHEWDILGHCMKVFETDPLTSSTKKVYSTIYLTVLTRRKAGWFVANIFVPTFLMLVVSWLTFIYEPHGARSDRNDVSMSTLLLSISNKFVVGDAMPKVDYRTLVDIYVDTCFYLQVLTMLANAVVEKYQDMPILGSFGRHLNLSFFVLELIAAFCLHEWFFVSLWNHRADILDWVEASKDKYSDESSEGRKERRAHRDDFGVMETQASLRFDESFKEDHVSATSIGLSAPDSINRFSTSSSYENTEWHGIASDGLRQRRGAHPITAPDTLFKMFDSTEAMQDSSGSASPERKDGVDTPPYFGYTQSKQAVARSDLSNSSILSDHDRPPAVTQLAQGIMLQSNVAPALVPTPALMSYASSSSSFFAAPNIKKLPRSNFGSEPDAETVSPFLVRADSKGIYKTRTRRVSSVSTMLELIERFTGPGAFWVGANRLNDHNGASIENEDGAVRRMSTPHFTNFGAGASGVTATGCTGNINEARRLQSNMHIERANVVSEMFKRTASRAGLKEALALRNERKIERLREIERLEAELKPARGSSINSYFGSDRDRASPEVTRNLAGVQYALWEVKEEAFIRSMAAKVLQHRWRLIRARRQLQVLNSLRDQALLEGYASRIQRTFRLRRVLKTIRQNKEKMLSIERDNAK